MELLFKFLAIGAVGALAREIIEDGCLIMPNVKSGKIYLGCIGGILIGGIAAVLADNDPITALAAGYAGTSFLQSAMNFRNKIGAGIQESMEDIIRRVCAEEVVDADLAIRVAKCESGLNANAKNKNNDGSIDRGLFQINNKYHPEISDIDAFDAEKSTRFFCKAFKAGNLSWWNASKKCWDLT